MKEFNYHVAYSADKEGYFGAVIGCTQIIRTTRIKSVDDLDSVRKFLEEKNGMKNLVIINLIELKPTKGKK